MPTSEKPGRNLIYGETTDAILTAARKVHSRLGPGLLEQPYKVCLAIEMQRAGIKFETEKMFPSSTTVSSLRSAIASISSLKPK